jgi:hypothetical protein
MYVVIEFRSPEQTRLARKKSFGHSFVFVEEPCEVNSHRAFSPKTPGMHGDQAIFIRSLISAQNPPVQKAFQERSVRNVTRERGPVSPIFVAEGLDR